MTYTIGIDVGGTNTDIGLVRSDGKIVARKHLKTNTYTDFSLYISDIMAAISSLMKTNEIGSLEGIGMGAPNGNFYTGCIDNAPNLTMKGNLDVQKEMHKYINVPVVLSNDANAAAFGEYVYGAGKNLKHFIMFTLGTGVGSGIVIDGKLIHGSTGAAGELGHAILIPNGRQCSCGRKGCLETYTSARGIVQTFCELRQEAANYQGLLAGVDDELITCKMIGDAANEGDRLAIETYERTGHLLGIAMANSVTFSAPEAVFVMGGPTNVGEPLLQPLRRSFKDNLLNIYQGTVDVHVSQLPANEVAILGAAALVKMV